MSKRNLIERVAAANAFLSNYKDNAALKEFEILATASNTYGLVGLSLCHFNGWGVTKDRERAYNLAKVAANSEDLFSLLYLARLSEEITPEKVAFSLYHRAAIRLSAIGNYQTGLRYLRGEGIEPDEDQALDYLLAARDQGHIWASRVLAELYIQGKFGRLRVPVGYGIVGFGIMRIIGASIKYGRGYPLAVQRLSISDWLSLIQYGRSITANVACPW